MILAEFQFVLKDVKIVTKIINYELNSTENSKFSKKKKTCNFYIKYYSECKFQAFNNNSLTNCRQPTEIDKALAFFHAFLSFSISQMSWDIS